MVAKDLHQKPFSEETITKLELFEKYLEKWLPVAIVASSIDCANICDFFAGPGQDCNGTKGSPLRIIQVVKDFTQLILRYKFKIEILINENKKNKYKQLETNINNEKKRLEHLRDYVNINHYNEDFKKLFNDQKSVLRHNFNLLFLDQNGVKQISEEIFLDLVQLPKTDFMFFISSSVFKRFADNENFLKHFPDIDVKKIKNTKQSRMHQLIFQYYKDKISPDSPTKLYPFTLKKGRNIYGLIFGTKHPLGVDKFLDAAWKTNELNGDANFDIYDDFDASQMTLDFIDRKLSKIEKFEKNLKEYIFFRNQISNKEIYDFTLENGHIPKHASIVLKKLKKEKQIDFSGHTNISYQKCYKQRDIKKFTRG